jgi:hypothetical protein
MAAVGTSSPRGFFYSLYQAFFRAFRDVNRDPPLANLHFRITFLLHRRCAKIRPAVVRTEALKAARTN